MSVAQCLNCEGAAAYCTPCYEALEARPTEAEQERDTWQKSYHAALKERQQAWQLLEAERELRREALTALYALEYEHYHQTYSECAPKKVLAKPENRALLEEAQDGG